MIIKTGAETLTPSNEDSIVNLMYTVVGQSGNEFEVITSHFWHGMMAEDKIKMFHEMGAVNGIKVDSKGKVQMITDKADVAVVKADKVKERTEATA